MHFNIYTGKGNDAQKKKRKKNWIKPEHQSKIQPNSPNQSTIETAPKCNTIFQSAYWHEKDIPHTYFITMGSYAVTSTSVSTPLRRKFAKYTWRNEQILEWSTDQSMLEQCQTSNIPCKTELTLTIFCASLPCRPLEIAYRWL